MSTIKDFIYSLLFRNRDISEFRVKPVMDGAFSANNKLDEASVINSGVTAPDDLLSGPDGKLYVSSGEKIVVFDNPEFTRKESFAAFDAEVGGLGWSQDGQLMACVSGRGVCVLNEKGVVDKWLESVDGVKLACPTSLAAAADGTVYITDGSCRNPTDQWLHDLMANEQGSGRLISWDKGLNNAHVIAKGFSWPGGAVVSHDENEVLVTEAWAYKLCAVNRHNGERRYLVDNFAGYPWRITRGVSGEYWLAFFAVRSQLIDFVLHERDYCDRMMAEVPPEYWVGPALSSKSHYLHPTQWGRIKTLGVQKPWAPARSYGLVARLDGDGQAIESFHSRLGGKVHGITSVRCIDKKIIACSKGDDKLVAVI
jgi:hypothetical protein